jgi:PKD repeat protein
VTAQHTYAAAGTYTVTLTVTDDDGATDTETSSVTVTAAPADPNLALDTFSDGGQRARNRRHGWCMDRDRWHHVLGHRRSARVSVPAGRSGRLRLAGVSSQNTRVQHSVKIEQLPTGSGVYLSTLVRATSSGDYAAKVRIESSGRVTLVLTKVVSGTDTALSSIHTVSGLTYTAGMTLNVRVEAQGASPTTLRAKVWAASGTEPASWQVHGNGQHLGTAGARRRGVLPYLSSSATSAVVVRYDDLQATPL